MIYRPQFVYATPSGASEDGYEHYFDTSNVNAQSLTPSNTPLQSILFQLDRDAQFIWEGFKVYIPGSDPHIGVQWKDAEGNLLSDDTINILLYAVGQGYAAPFSGGMGVVFDEEIICPPGAVLESNWSREITSGNINVPVAVTLLGKKRRYQ